MFEHSLRMTDEPLCIGVHYVHLLSLTAQVSLNTKTGKATEQTDHINCTFLLKL